MDGERIYVQSDISLIMSVKPSDTYDLLVERNGKRILLEDVLFEAREFEQDGKTVQKIGVSFETVDATLWQRLKYTWNGSLDYVRTVRLSLGMLFSGEAGVKDMSGPVGIVDMMVDVASDSQSLWLAVSNMLWFGGFIAVNLAIMNLLPIPALDGGRVVGLLLTTGVEAITRKKLDPKYEGYLHGAGMILLLALMALILFKDIFMIFQR
jgi:regulator of sigma E protease